MKKRNLFITLGLALGLGVGVFAGLKAGQEVKEVKAAGETKLYFDLTNATDWNSSGAQTYLRVFTNPTTFYSLDEFEEVSTGYYTFSADISSGCQLVRIASGVAKANIVDKSSNEGGSIWTYGSNYSSGNYLCTVSGYAANWSGMNGVSEEYTTASTTASTTTKRVWVDPKDGFYEGSARAALRVFGDALTTTNYILNGSSQYTIVNGQWLFYVDIPVSANCQLVRLHNVFNFIWEYGDNIFGYAGYNTAKVVYAYDSSVSYSVANEDNNVTVEYAKLVLDGYSTCVDSADNGYQAIGNINSCVLNYLSSSNLTSLRGTDMDANYNYGNKIDHMAYLNGSNPTPRIGLDVTTLSENNYSMIVIIAVSAVAVLALGGYFALRRRKED